MAITALYVTTFGVIAFFNPPFPHAGDLGNLVWHKQLGYPAAFDSRSII